MSKALDKLSSLNHQHSQIPNHQGDPIPLRRALPEADPYPVDALGPLLSATTKRLADVIQAPLALCAQSVLAGATLAVQGHANVEVDGRSSPLSEFFLTIGESGERKSAVDRIVMLAFREHERNLSAAYAAEMQSHVNAIAAFDKKRADAVKDGNDVKAALDALGTPPLEPLLPLCLCDEPTRPAQLVCKIGSGGVSC